MSPIMPWILYAIIPTVQFDHYEYAGETACKSALTKITQVLGGSDAVKKANLTLVCVPRGEPDYRKMSWANKPLYYDKKQPINKQFILPQKEN